ERAGREGELRGGVDGKEDREPSADAREVRRDGRPSDRPEDEQSRGEPDGEQRDPQAAPGPGGVPWSLRGRLRRAVQFQSRGGGHSCAAALSATREGSP